MSKSNNHFEGRSGWFADTIVCHITQGGFEGSVGWLCNPASGVSAHAVVARDGRIERLVDYKDGAWANGTSLDATSRIFYGNSTLTTVRDRKTNANFYSYSIEHEGFLNEMNGGLTEPQYAATLSLIKEMITDMKSRYGITFSPDREHLVGHNQITPITKPNCPGSEFPFDRILADIKAWMGVPQEQPVQPTPAPSTGLAVGDKVVIKQSASNYTNGVGIAQLAKGRESTISQISGNKVLVAYNGVAIGWVYETDVEEIGQPSAPVVVEGIQLNDTVVINSGAQHFTNGATIANFAKNRNSQVAQISGNKLLLKYNGGIVGWVYNYDCTEVDSQPAPVQPAPQPVDNTIRVGDNIKIKSTAVKFTNGAKIAGFAKERTSKAQQINGAKVLVVFNGGIVGWVYTADCYKV